MTQPTQGGAAIPVAETEGRPVVGRVAQPIAYVTGQGEQGGAARPIVEVASADFDSGVYIRGGGPALPVVARTGAVLGGPATPVYVVGAGPEPPPPDPGAPLTLDSLWDTSAPVFLGDRVLRDKNDAPLKDQSTPNLVPFGRPYLDTDLWNTPIGPSPTIDPDSATYVTAFSTDLVGAARTPNTNPNTFAYPVYAVHPAETMKTVTYTGAFSDVDEDGNLTVDTGGGTTTCPLPVDALNSAGSDSSVIVVRPSTGEEWGFWRLTNNQDGTFGAQNGYHTYTTRTAYQPSGFLSRGGGLTYLSGLIRNDEILAGEIPHALAFAYDKGRAAWIPPVCTKSDGTYVGSDGLPYGARIQLDPSIDEATIRSWSPEDDERDSCYIICRALQVYGAFLIDFSGSWKLITEDNLTATWENDWTNRFLTNRSLRNMPWNVLRVLLIEGVES